VQNVIPYATSPTRTLCTRRTPDTVDTLFSTGFTPYSTRLTGGRRRGGDKIKRIFARPARQLRRGGEVRRTGKLHDRPGDGLYFRGSDTPRADRRGPESGRGRIAIRVASRRVSRFGLPLTVPPAAPGEMHPPDTARLGRCARYSAPGEMHPPRGTARPRRRVTVRFAFPSGHGAVSSVVLSLSPP